MSDETTLSHDEQAVLATHEAGYGPTRAERKMLAETVRRLDRELVAARRERDWAMDDLHKAMDALDKTAEQRNRLRAALENLLAVCPLSSDSSSARDDGYAALAAARHPRPDMPPPAPMEVVRDGAGNEFPVATPPAEKVCWWTWDRGAGDWKTACGRAYICNEPEAASRCGCGGRISVKEETT